MTVTSEADRRRAVIQTLASWRIGGFEPDGNDLALLDRYVEGEMTLAEIAARVDEAFSRQIKAVV